jgi:hypothetical protein
MMSNKLKQYIQESVKQYLEASKKGSLEEGVEDRQSELNSAFVCQLPHITGITDRRKYIKQYQTALTKFSRGYDRDDDDKIDDALGDMEGVVQEMRRATRFKDADTFMGKLEKSRDSKHSSMFDRMTDELLDSKAAVVEKAIKELDAFMKTSGL